MKPSLEETKAVEKEEVKVFEKPDTLKLDKSQLESYISEIEANLSNGKYVNKTDESVAILRADLSGARSVLVSATTQDELKSAYNKLVTTVNSKLKNKPVEKALLQKPDTTDGKETVGVKAENTEPKSTDKRGSKDERNGKEMIEGSGFRSATEGYTLETTEKRHENGEFATATGKSYEVLDNNPNYKLYVHGYQSENTDRPSVPNETPASGGRADIPLSKEEAEKLKRESILWDGRIRPTAKKNNGVINRRDDKALENYLNILKSDGAGRYGACGAYEFLATEIYGYAYEQGKHYVYIKDVKNRFRLSKEAQDAGYRISNKPEVVYEKDATRDKGAENITIQGKDGQKVTPVTKEKDPQTGKLVEKLGEPKITPATNTVVKVATKDKVETKEIPAKVRYVGDETKDKGSEPVRTEGKKGKEVTTTV